MKPLDIEIRRPIAPSVAMFVCAEVALFALIGLAKLPMPGLWWAVAADSTLTRTPIPRTSGQ